MGNVEPEIVDCRRNVMAIVMSYPDEKNGCRSVFIDESKFDKIPAAVIIHRIFSVINTLQEEGTKGKFELYVMTAREAEETMAKGEQVGTFKEEAAPTAPIV